MVDSLIDQTHFKSFTRLYPLIHQRYPNLKKSEIQAIIEKRLHDRHLKLKQKKPYMRQIFDPVIGCYFHDLLEQTKDRTDQRLYPPFFHVFIESNSRYAFAYPTYDKTALTAISNVKKLIQDLGGFPVVKLTSDGEAAFQSNEFTNFCNSQNITVRIVPDKAHSTLGLIDRFMRTLRDMHQPVNKSQEQQYDKKFLNFSIYDMIDCLDKYNNTFHKSIGCTPREMMENKDKEKEYIRKKMRYRQIQDHISDFVLPVGTYVRYRMNNEDLNGKKRRSQFSREKYKVMKKVGDRYLLEAMDGKVISKSRFELIIAEDDEPLGDTFPQNKRVNDQSVITGILFH